MRSTLALGFVLAAMAGWIGYRALAVPVGPAVSGSAETFSCTVASVTDGDTFRCSELDASGRQIRVRIAGIDARERNGSCAPGHPCASASAEAATAALFDLVDGQRLQCDPENLTYGRIAAFCRRNDGRDISCAMVDSGTVARWERYWGGHRC